MALPFTSLQAIISAFLANQQDSVAWTKISAAPVLPAAYHSTWTDLGSPGPGATDSSGTQYVNGSGGSGASANAGGISFAQIAISPLGRVLTEFSAAAATPCTVILADRLCAISGITVTSTGSKTLTTLPALPRYTNGIGVEAWLEVTTAFTTTAGSFFLDSYTGSNNIAGTNATSARLTTAISGSIKAGDMIGPFPLLSPDVGVKAVASFNVNAAPATGVVNLVLLKRLATMVNLPIVGSGASRNLVSMIPSLPTVVDGATYMVMFQTGNAGANTLTGTLVSAYT